MQYIGQTQNRNMSLWLFGLAILVVMMIILGGLTRLTDSGLSITQWKPITGAIPPLNLQQWKEAFQQYQQIPQFKLINSEFTLEDFKVIYWWEWSHRQLGRLIGLYFVFPLLVFALRRQIPKTVKKPLFYLLILGLLQAGLGWYMVKSGLSQRVDVSQYRLAAHLGLALLLFAYSVWIAFSLWTPIEWKMHKKKMQDNRGVVFFAFFLLVLVFMQSIMGAFVAGLDAGKIYTDWPLMEGELFPDELWVYGNFLDSPISVQFIHRMGAYFLFICVCIHVIQLYKCQHKHQKTVLVLLAVITIQAFLGILTLVMSAPLWLAISHQFFAIIVLYCTIYHCYRLVSTCRR